MLSGCAAGCAFGSRVAGFSGRVLECSPARLRTCRRQVCNRLRLRSFRRRVRRGCVAPNQSRRPPRSWALFPLFRIRPGCLVCSKRMWAARRRSPMPRTVSSSAQAGASTARVGMVPIAVTPGSHTALVPTLVLRSAHSGLSIPLQPRRRVLRRCPRVPPACLRTCPREVCNRLRARSLRSRRAPGWRVAVHCPRARCPRARRLALRRRVSARFVSSCHRVVLRRSCRWSRRRRIPPFGPACRVPFARGLAGARIDHREGRVQRA